MGVLTRQVLDVVDTLSRRAQAPQQAGIFVGANPAAYSANDPIQLWVIQVIIILAMIQFLAFFLSRIRQPRVIAEVIGGVLLGPSVMGRIPGFSSSVFPPASLPMINLTSTIGLVLFLFLVGLEIDVRVIRRNAKASMAISTVGLIIPLGLGATLGIPIYHQFVDPSVNYGYFLLFVAVAIGITAFPVLCRILTELKLLEDTVGTVVLAAGVGNDVVGWILLALTVALVNADSGLTALWVLLTAVGYTLFLLVPVRLAFRWVAQRTGSLETGQPTAIMMTLTLVLVFFSAFFTDIIGIHAIFGGFLAGLIVPHDNGLAISLVEKLEDLVSLLFLPLYFVSSGLKTNLGLLDNGITWGYTILICVVAFFSKFLGCAITAKLFGFSYRESGAIGSLMSCKGLVELIVLNVGLSAGILDTRTFSMFVLHALVLTFITTPLTLAFYPAKYRTRAQTLIRKPSATQHEAEKIEHSYLQQSIKTNFAVVVDRIEQLPSLMTLTQLLQLATSHSGGIAPSGISDAFHGKEKDDSPSLSSLPYTPAPSPRVSMDVLRLIELTDRTSAVLKSQSLDIVEQSDPVLSIFRTFALLHRMAVSSTLRVVAFEEFAPSIAKFAQDASSQMIILPWNGTLGNDNIVTGVGGPSPPLLNPFDNIFGHNQPAGASQRQSGLQIQLFRKMFAAATTDVALYADQGISQPVDHQAGLHIFLPFFGGPDDRLALSFVTQLCMNPSISATVVRFVKVDSDQLTPMSTIEEAKRQAQMVPLHALPDTVYANDTQLRLASDTADNFAWQRHIAGSIPELRGALGRMTLSEEHSSLPLHAMLGAAEGSASRHAQSRLLVVVGRSRRLAVELHTVELQQILAERNTSLGSETIKTVGDVGSVFVAAKTNASLLVLQAFLS